MDPETNVLEFSDMFKAVKKGVRKGVLLPHRVDRYRQLGWDSGAKIEFYVMPLHKWENILSAKFRKVEKRLGRQAWAKPFPIYVAVK